MGYACTNHLTPRYGVVGIWGPCEDAHGDLVVAETVCVPWKE